MSRAEPNPPDHPASGSVLRLRADWERLLGLLPELRPAAVVYRGRHAILCQLGPFPPTTLVARCALRTGTRGGASLRLDHWAEAWWYEEHRNGRLTPCLEIADELGRGMLKFCYADHDSAAADHSRLETLVEESCDTWELIHLRSANRMDCSTAHRLPSRPLPADHLRAIFGEAATRGLELAVLVPTAGLAVWDSIRPQHPECACCWLSASHDHGSLHLELSGLRSSRVYAEADRTVATFFDEHREPALTLIEPSGARMHSLRDLRRATAPHDPNQAS